MDEPWVCTVHPSTDRIRQHPPPEPSLFCSAHTTYIYTEHRLATIYIAGNNIVSVNRVGKARVVFKIVGLKRGVMDYRNNLFIARNVGWRLIGRNMGEDFFERQLKAETTMAAEVRAFDLG